MTYICIYQRSSVGSKDAPPRSCEKGGPGKALDFSGGQNGKGPVLGGYGERILLPDSLRVKLTNSCWRDAHENGDDTGVSVFCNGSRFSRRGAVANARTMHVLGRNQHSF